MEEQGYVQIQRSVAYPKAGYIDVGRSDYLYGRPIDDPLNQKNEQDYVMAHMSAKERNLYDKLVSGAALTEDEKTLYSTLMQDALRPIKNPAANADYRDNLDRAYGLKAPEDWFSKEDALRSVLTDFKNAMSFKYGFGLQQAQYGYGTQKAQEIRQGAANNNYGASPNSVWAKPWQGGNGSNWFTERAKSFDKLSAPKADALAAAKEKYSALKLSRQDELSNWESSMTGLLKQLDGTRPAASTDPIIRLLKANMG